MRHMRGYYATAEAVIALGTFGWTFFLLVDQPEIFWPALTLVAALFFAVTSWLMAIQHPDARVVGLFGLLFYGLVGIFMPIFDRHVRTDGTLLTAVILALLAIGIPQAIVLWGAGRVPREEPVEGPPA